MSAPTFEPGALASWAVDWLVTALVAAAPLALATAALAHAAASRGRARRPVWLTGMFVVSAWPLVAGLLATLLPSAITTMIGATGVVRLDAIYAAGLEPHGGSWRPFVAAAWLGAVALMLGRLAVGATLLHRCRRSWEANTVDGVAVRLSDDVGPAVVGVRRMELVLPRWIVTLDAPLRALVLRHEEEHRRVGDPRLLLAAESLLALAPWNPALWWMASRFRDAMELDCDARVLGERPGPRDVERYGLLLMLISQRRAVAPLLAPALTERGSSLERRILAMRRPLTGSRSRTLGFFALAAGALATACAVVAPDVSPTDSVQPSSPPAAETSTDQPRFGTRVTAQVTPLPGSRAPKYPPDLRAAGIEGEVLVQFVVDTTGRAEMASLEVLQSSHEAFAEAVRVALAEMRFTTADVSGRKVRQLVQLPFVFGISR